MHSSKRKSGKKAYKRFLGITVLARLQGVTSLAKSEKPSTALNRKIRKTAIIFDKNRKLNTNLEKTHKPYKTPKPKNRSFYVRKPKIGEISKTEYPNAPSVIAMQYHQLPVGLIAQLVQHCTGIAEVMVSNPVQV